MPTHDPRIDAYIAKSADFAQPILTHLRQVVHSACPDTEETLKWSMPTFMHGGKILAHMAAFKAHCGFGFWQDVAQTGNTGAMGQFGRIATLKDLPSKAELVKHVKKAAVLIDSGEKPVRAAKSAPKPPPEIPPDLRAALARNAKARKTFQAFSPSHQREYIDWLAEAKREETREKRLLQAIEWMEEGKSRHWKYQNC
ncbi:MAG TPA: YdeI/OmpD-associated family protein [Ramlibacter sp.]|nr:YdeI/OmpD-associated family protein [Ramlibacter sp.]